MRFSDSQLFNPNWVTPEQILEFSQLKTGGKAFPPLYEVFETVSSLSAVISSHTARRTFINMCLNRGMPIQDVMKMSGHSDYKSMKPYINVTRKHLRMVANKWEI